MQCQYHHIDLYNVYYQIVVRVYAGVSFRRFHHFPNGQFASSGLCRGMRPWDFPCNLPGVHHVLRNKGTDGYPSGFLKQEPNKVTGPNLSGKYL